jgi:hypothetical protein
LVKASSAFRGLSQVAVTLALPSIALVIGRYNLQLETKNDIKQIQEINMMPRGYDHLIYGIKKSQAGFSNTDLTLGDYRNQK